MDLMRRLLRRAVSFSITWRCSVSYPGCQVTSGSVYGQCTWLRHQAPSCMRRCIGGLCYIRAVPAGKPDTNTLLDIS
jgi:hypothetical protein